MNWKQKHIKYSIIGLLLFFLLPGIGTIVGIILFYKAYKEWPKHSLSFSSKQLLWPAVGTLILTYLTFGWLIKGLIVHDYPYFIIGGVFALCDYYFIVHLIRKIEGSEDGEIFMYGLKKNIVATVIICLFVFLLWIIGGSKTISERKLDVKNLTLEEFIETRPDSASIADFLRPYYTDSMKYNKKVYEALEYLCYISPTKNDTILKRFISLAENSRNTNHETKQYAKEINNNLQRNQIGSYAKDFMILEREKGNLYLHDMQANRIRIYFIDVQYDTALDILTKIQPPSTDELLIAIYPGSNLSGYNHYRHELSSNWLVGMCDHNISKDYFIRSNPTSYLIDGKTWTIIETN